MLFWNINGYWSRRGFPFVGPHLGQRTGTHFSYKALKECTFWLLGGTDWLCGDINFLFPGAYFSSVFFPCLENLRHLGQKKWAPSPLCQSRTYACRVHSSIRSFFVLASAFDFYCFPWGPWFCHPFITSAGGQGDLWSPFVHPFVALYLFVGCLVCGGV